MIDEAAAADMVKGGQCRDKLAGRLGEKDGTEPIGFNLGQGH